MKEYAQRCAKHFATMSRKSEFYIPEGGHFCCSPGIFLNVWDEKIWVAVYFLEVEHDCSFYRPSMHFPVMILLPACQDMISSLQQGIRKELRLKIFLTIWKFAHNWNFLMTCLNSEGDSNTTIRFHAKTMFLYRTRKFYPPPKKKGIFWRGSNFFKIWRFFSPIDQKFFVSLLRS